MAIDRVPLRMCRALDTLVAIALVAACWGGCAGRSREAQLERVAKDWCQTIRASQVIPVYPLTEDLEPGDVFLVQTSIQAESNVYKSKGFLPMDDRRVRLTKTDYAGVYFDGFWEDEWGAGKHKRAERTAGRLADAATARDQLTKADAPRVTFPSYSFEVRRGGSFGLALPIKGVPFGLAYMRSDRATGSVTIADARTYSANPWALYKALEEWAEDPEVRLVLSETARQANRVVFLRVVSRVYLTGAVVVSLHNRSTQGAGAQAGAPPDVKILKNDGTVNENFDEAMEALNRAAAPSTAVGGRVDFVQATSRDVVLSEAFDRLLAVGYLGFDVPVYPGGVLGVPIPTYERLERMAPDPPQSAGTLTIEQAHFVVMEHALERLGERNPEQAVRVMRGVSRLLGDPPELKAARDALLNAGGLGYPELYQAALAEFKSGAAEYVSAGGGSGPRYARHAEAFALAYDARDQAV